MLIRKKYSHLNEPATNNTTLWSQYHSSLKQIDLSKIGEKECIEISLLFKNVLNLITFVTRDQKIRKINYRKHFAQIYAYYVSIRHNAHAQISSVILSIKAKQMKP